MPWLVILLLAVSAAAYPPPNPQILRLQLAADPAASRAIVEATIQDDPNAALRQGIVYLNGHLLDELGRPDEAASSFAASLDGPELLLPFSRYRLARSRLATGQVEVATGLLTTLLSRPAAASLRTPATALLVRSLAAGGDCRQLAQVASWPLPQAEKRRLRLAAVDCQLADDRLATAAAELERLLRENATDPTARLAAERLAELPPSFTAGPEAALLLGSTFYHHREFELAILYLERGIEARYGDGEPLSRAEFEHRYALARSTFWNRDYALAARRFAALAGRTRTAASTSKSLFQRSRSLELSGDWQAAADAFRATYNADPDGEFSGSALISALRIEWRSGREETALEIFGTLRQRSQWRSTAERAALFLAASDIVRDRADRAGPWLEYASGRSSSRVEASYWKGRLAELREDRAAAIESYLDTLRADPRHPLGEAAARRLKGPRLAAAARVEGERLARSQSSADLQGARLLLGETTAGRAATAALRKLLTRSTRHRAFLDLRTVAPEDWPAWSTAVSRPEDLLLRLGIWGEAGPSIQRLFPVSDPDLALTGSRLLFLGGQHRRSLYVAEILDQRRPADLPPELLPEIFRQLVYPLPWSELIYRASATHGVDPHLLAALIREESRFEATAVSPASARGLTQFVFATAAQLAAAAGLGTIGPDDLDLPRVSIPLGAAYLSDLGSRAEGFEPWVLAAYNAGEDQARLWLSYCHSREPEEYFTKVGFRESRGYLRKVLTGRAHYRELYPLPEARR